MDCSKLEAHAERRLAAQVVLPFVAQKLPMLVDMRHTRAIHLNIVEPGQMAQLQQLADDAVSDSDLLNVVTGNPPPPELTLIAGPIAAETTVVDDGNEAGGMLPGVPKPVIKPA